MKKPSNFILILAVVIIVLAMILASRYTWSCSEPIDCAGSVRCGVFGTECVSDKTNCNKCLDGTLCGQKSGTNERCVCTDQIDGGAYQNCHLQSGACERDSDCAGLIGQDCKSAYCQMETKVCVCQIE
jgi:hypothetical protein